MAIASVATFERFFREASDIDIDKNDIQLYQEFVRAKISDLLTIAQARARADDREMIERRDLPITKGLLMTIRAFRRLAIADEMRPLLEGVAARPQLDLAVADEIDAALSEIAGGLSLALGQTFRIIDPNLRNPQTEHWDRAFRIFDLLV